jgi:hypothetical protein
MQYVVMKDIETSEVDFVGRFKDNAIGEIWQDGKWVAYSNLVSDLLDGLLENITEAEAKKIISKQRKPDLQAA